MRKLSSWISLHNTLADLRWHFTTSFDFVLKSTCSNQKNYKKLKSCFRSACADCKLIWNYIFRKCPNVPFLMLQAIHVYLWSLSRMKVTVPLTTFQISKKQIPLDGKKFKAFADHKLNVEKLWSDRVVNIGEIGWWMTASIFSFSHNTLKWLIQVSLIADGH